MRTNVILASTAAPRLERETFITIDTAGMCAKSSCTVAARTVASASRPALLNQCLAPSPRGFGPGGRDSHADGRVADIPFEDLV